MKLSVLGETWPGERRVAVVADTVKRLAARGWQVRVQAGAGEAAGVSDDDYARAGAAVERDVAALHADVDVLVRIRPPARDELARIAPGTTLVCHADALADADRVAELAARKLDLVAVELIPRTTLAQMMDVLSSQATVAGYRAVLLAAEASPRLFPMLMTAAGTIAASSVLVVGAGVAGLSAIATARRLGAVVEAFDVRKTVKEQVESLGARFVEVASDEDAQTASGYARELSEEYKTKQQELLAERLASCDVCITTAQIPGQRAPTLITAEMVRGMKRGAVIVDLAAERGGNCALTRPGHRVAHEGVLVIGDLNLPSSVAVHASQTYSRNMEKLLSHLYKSAALDGSDEITRAVWCVRAGTITDERIRARLDGGSQDGARAANGEA